MSNANIALVQDLYAAFSRGDVATIIAAPCARRRIGRAAVAGPTSRPSDRARGRSEVQTFFSQVAENLDFSEFTPREFCPSGDKVFVSWFLRGHDAQVGKIGSVRMGARLHGARRQGRAFSRVHRHRTARGRLPRLKTGESYGGATISNWSRQFFDEVCNARRLDVADRAVRVRSHLPRPRQSVGREGTRGHAAT